MESKPTSIAENDQPALDDRAAQSKIAPTTRETVRANGNDVGTARRSFDLNRIRRWGLGLSDAFAVMLGILVAAVAGKFYPGSFTWSCLMIPAWLFFAKINNLYDHDHRRIRHSTFDEIPAVVVTAVFTVISVKGFTELLSVAKIHSAALIIIGGVAIIASLCLRGLVRFSCAKFAQGERTVIVGAGTKAALVARRLIRHPEAGIVIVGYISSSEDLDEDGPLSEGLTYFGSIAELPEVAKTEELERVVIADDGMSSRALGKLIADCRQADVAVTVVPSNHEVLGPDTELNRVGEVPMLDFHFSKPPLTTLAIKRALDICVASFFLVLASPILAVAAVLIKLDSPGPVFFRQVRVGQHGKRFTMFKLRTMVADAEKRLDELIDLEALDEPAFKLENDPRVTKVGRFLRRTSIDEIPQFINVLRGEMSLVGPRPEEEAVVALYDERQRERLLVKPGLTGPMQVYGRGSLSFEERLALERDYLNNLSVTGDLAILLRTPRAVVKGDGAF